jgi:hypothetical protein
LPHRPVSRTQAAILVSRNLDREAEAVTRRLVGVGHLSVSGFDDDKIALETGNVNDKMALRCSYFLALTSCNVVMHPKTTVWSHSQHDPPARR